MKENWPKNPLLQMLILEVAKALIAFLVKKWQLDTEDGEATKEIVTILKQNLKNNEESV